MITLSFTQGDHQSSRRDSGRTLTEMLPCNTANKATLLAMIELVQKLDGQVL